ncbi:SDR family NAD(P)-dependent oxidoreductase [Nocardia sp. NEAU-G5]|uniref:SDR family NAD(P)-dependent oxidoreductase n=1 Tax=Nocardia albiluteola TaxID=2842303 RepID=A0ABS6AQZ6_9NOCA|nr:type I polyketide synthase [Nocardia albiluteola]MBU3059971.1 SDR family NAD(P)-dependent oxidoreductase [Nocardia albiluteola]
MTAPSFGGSHRRPESSGGRRRTTGPVAIIGIGCRVAGARGVEELWRLLHEAHDRTGPPPEQSGPHRAGHPDRLDAFDNDWFGISEREAAAMDPRQRLCLEVAIEAIDDAGVGFRIRGSRTAVLFGAGAPDHDAAADEGDAADPIPESTPSGTANRLSFALQLHGPSLVVDSARSSSPVALDLAVRLLADGAASLAIVGGVDVELPHTSGYSDRDEFPAAHGYRAPFDHAADAPNPADAHTAEYRAAGDSCTVLVLQRTADAHCDGNRIYAEIAGSAVGFDGRSNRSDESPGSVWQQIVRSAWAGAGFDPGATGSRESDGTERDGTGHDAESEDLTAVLSGSERTGAIPIDSVTSKLGELGAAAGIAEVAKAALSIARGFIPPTSTFRPFLRLGDHGPREPAEAADWNTIVRSDRYAGVGSSGLGGTTAHVVLRGVDQAVGSRDGDPPFLIPITGRDETDLREKAARWADTLAESPRPLRESAPAAGRSIPEQLRAAVLAWTPADAIALLRALADSRNAPPDRNAADVRNIHRTDRDSLGNSEAAHLEQRATDSTHHNHRGAVFGPGVERRGGLLLMFSGPGGQHARMGRGLAARHPVFARAVQDAADAVAGAGGPRVWTPRHGFSHSLAAVDAVQPALFVYQVAVAELLAHWGIRPGAVIGHGPGEIAAAVVSGAISLRDGARIVVARGAILARLDRNDDAIALLEATSEEVSRLIEPMRARVGIAAVHGPRSVVVSGEPRHIEALIRRAVRRGLVAQALVADLPGQAPRVRELPVDPAARIDNVDRIARPDGVDPAARLAGVDPLVPDVPVYSTTRRGAVLTATEMDTGYWAENISGTVELAAAVEAALADGYSTVLELSPHPVLASVIRAYPGLRDATYPVADRDDESAAYLGAVARIHLEGRFVDWAAQGPFPGAVFERCWQPGYFPRTADAVDDPGAEDLRGHVVRGAPTVPAMFWLRQFQRIGIGTTTRLLDFTVHEHPDLPRLDQVTYRAGADLLEACGPAVLASARRGERPTPAEIVGWMRTIDAHHGAHPGLQPLDPARLYERLRERGLEYGPRFRALRGILRGSHSAIGYLGHIRLDSAALAGCIQLVVAAAGARLPEGVLPLTTGIDSAWITDAPGTLLSQAHAFVRTADPTGLRCDILATDQHGAPAVALLGVRIGYSMTTGHTAHTYTATTGYEWLAHPQNQSAYPKPVARPPAVTTRPGSSSASNKPFGSGADLDRSATNAATVPAASGGRGRPGRPASSGYAPAGSVLRRERWSPVNTSDFIDTGHDSRIGRVLVVGQSPLAGILTQAVDSTRPVVRVARDPAEAIAGVSSALTESAELTAVVAVWPVAAEVDDIVAAVGQALKLLQRIVDHTAVASLTVVLRDPNSTVQQSIAGLVRSLQLESERPVRLVWVAPGHDEPWQLPELVLRTGGPDEVRVGPEGVRSRTFVPATDLVDPFDISCAGTYVVTGGLGALGAVAARWLLDAGAGDVVVLTRRPRPLPPLLEGREDRIVVVRCDVTDPRDLANALHDIRECGSPIRGLVHSAGALRGAEFGAVTPDLLTAMFEPKLGAVTGLLTLTAGDPVDFVLLCSSATGSLGAPGQAAYAAANAALDAAAHIHDHRRVISIGWGTWASGLSADEHDGVAQARRAGIAPFDTASGTAVLAAARTRRGPYLLALDYTPTNDVSPLATRLRTALPVPAAAPPGRAALLPGHTIALLDSTIDKATLARHAAAPFPDAAAAEPSDPAPTGEEKP